jgi:hypothetical protein
VSKSAGVSSCTTDCLRQGLHRNAWSGCARALILFRLECLRQALHGNLRLPRTHIETRASLCLWRLTLCICCIFLCATYYVWLLYPRSETWRIRAIHFLNASAIEKDLHSVGTGNHYVLLCAGLVALLLPHLVLMPIPIVLGPLITQTCSTRVEFGHSRCHCLATCSACIRLYLSTWPMEAVL